MKLMERMKRKKLGNKGFSLVELIIVIAIMAILIGIIGTQVVPYLRRAREERDMQVINAYSTAAVTFYSLHTDEFVDPEGKGGVVAFDVFNGNTDNPMYQNPTSDTFKGSLSATDFQTGIKELTGYSTLQNLKDAMVSTAAHNNMTTLRIVYNFGTETAEVGNVSTPAGAVTATALNGGTVILESATSYIKGF